MKFHVCLNSCFSATEKFWLPSLIQAISGQKFVEFGKSGKGDTVNSGFTKGAAKCGSV